MKKQKQKQKILINCTTELNSALAFIVFKLRYLIINNLFITLNCTCFSFPNRAPLQSVCGIFKSWELSLSVLTRLWACGIPAMKKKNSTTIKMHIWAIGFLTSRPKMYFCMDNQTLRYTFLLENKFIPLQTVN